MAFFDTNVLVYSVDGTQPAKQSIAQHLLREAIADTSLVLSTQVMQEFYDVVRRRRLLMPSSATEILRLWAENHVVGSSSQMVMQAVELQQRLQLSIWDCLIVQAALEAGCSRLFTEDLQHGMRIGDLEIVNPFDRAVINAVHEPTPEYVAAGAPRRRTRVKR
jgi:predicted nucleic acid-binding protein